MRALTRWSSLLRASRSLQLERYHPDLSDQQGGDPSLCRSRGQWRVREYGAECFKTPPRRSGSGYPRPGAAIRAAAAKRRSWRGFCAISSRSLMMSVAIVTQSAPQSRLFIELLFRCLTDRLVPHGYPKTRRPRPQRLGPTTRELQLVGLPSTDLSENQMGFEKQQRYSLSWRILPWLSSSGDINNHQDTPPSFQRRTQDSVIAPKRASDTSSA